ncbi:hypothetical protein J14TS2_04240 [Bacillus sp. J14TS2]|uniref:phosphodiester glycosidase family protein n=1 Tax=Bacillus sp. J14TS2 TaxID=2807188 RepID=UPI001B127B15|nr:phosphodiester glycosidase family protein [Bacillus sp. J14TS2]GIN69949.1 hypothetical protein J14TS2_04240 [Bacillus sp. J14TS2]
MRKGLKLFISMLLFTSIMIGHHAVTIHAEEDTEITTKAEYQVSPGVYHESVELKDGDSVNSLHMMEVDPQDSFVHFTPYSSNGNVYGLETVGNTIDEMREQGEQVVGGVNGDFFSSVGIPSGLQIVDGEIYTSPRSIKALIATFPDQSIKMEHSVEMTAELKATNGEVLELDMLNRSRVATHNDRAFLFNDRFGETAKTPEGGVEVVVDTGKGNDRFVAGKTLQGIVSSVAETADTQLEEGKIVVSVVGTKADWVTSHVAVGDEIRIDVNFTKNINQAQNVVSGNSTLGTVLLEDGEIWEELLEDDKKNTDKHPRTMLAIKAGKLYLFAVDGRQEGHSDGMTLPGAAAYLQSLGMEDAINIDGGGSTTYYVRQPGDEKPTLQNRPSDGPERPVGSSLLVISKAPQQSELAGIRLSPATNLKIVSGSKVRIEAKGYDEYSNPLAIEPNSLQWSVDKDIGEIDRSGLFVAGEGKKQGQIVVSKDGVSATKDVTVTDEVTELRISPTSFVIEPEKSQSFSVNAYDKAGEKIMISPDVLEWSVEGDIGEITEEGVLQTGNNVTTGKVVATYQDIRVETAVEVGPSPIIEDFEDESHIRSNEVRTVPGSVNMTLVSDPEYVLYGEKAAQLTYDFTGTEGTSAAYIQFLDDEGELGQEVRGEPTRFGVWVYGDQQYHHLRLGITDGNGQDALWNMTTVGGVNWTGWKYVYATVPEGTVFPLKVRYFALEEKNQNNKTAGLLYFDQFEAIYTDSEQKPDIELLLQDMMQSGDIQHPLGKQLTNKLRQATHHLNNGSQKQAQKFIDDFLERVNDPKNKQMITKEAKRDLNRKTVEAFNG